MTTAMWGNTKKPKAKLVQALVTGLCGLNILSRDKSVSSKTNAAQIKPHLLVRDGGCLTINGKDKRQ